MSGLALFTPRYLTRFRCLGSACEDTCCRDWNIFVDEEHGRALEARIGEPELGAVMRKLDGGGGGRYALLVLRDEDRACHFLGGDGLCTIQSRFGEELLPDLCATYPRVFGRAFDRLEVAASPSCPEIARLVLLGDDATERIPGDPALLGRGWIRGDRELDENTRDPYEANFLAVRSLAMGLLGAKEYPIASRLFFVAFFAESSRAYLRRGAEKFDFDGLQALGQGLRTAENLAKLDAQLPLVADSDRYALSVMHELVRVGAGVPQLAPLVAPLPAFYAARPEGGGDADAVDAWVRNYRALPPLAPERAARLDLLVERFATHELLRKWYVEESSFLVYVHQLLARVAFARFLVASHAAIAPPADGEAFDALIVRVVQRIARAFDRNRELAAELVHGLQAGGMPLAAAVSLIRV